jgi:hypothetical protein
LALQEPRLIKPPHAGFLRAAGYEMTDGDLPIQVTEICEIVAPRSSAGQVRPLYASSKPLLS